MSKHEKIKNNVMDIDTMSSSNWSSINPEYVTRMRKQNRFKTGLDIAKYTASIMRKDMEEYDACLLYTSPSPRDRTRSRMPSSA